MTKVKPTVDAEFVRRDDQVIQAGLVQVGTVQVVRVGRPGAVGPVDEAQRLAAATGTDSCSATAAGIALSTKGRSSCPASRCATWSPPAPSGALTVMISGRAAPSAVTSCRQRRTCASSRAASTASASV